MRLVLRAMLSFFLIGCAQGKAPAAVEIVAQMPEDMPLEPNTPPIAVDLDAAEANKATLQSRGTIVAKASKSTRKVSRPKIKKIETAQTSVPLEPTAQESDPFYEQVYDQVYHVVKERTEPLVINGGTVFDANPVENATLES